MAKERFSCWRTAGAAFLLCMATAVAAPAQAFFALHSFNGTDGSIPVAKLVQGTDGNFYGTTNEGGASYYGTVFKITPGGMLTTLHSFDFTDGTYPDAGLVQATDGNFYGTTSYGGGGPNGTVFKITPGGTLTTLHSFDLADGDRPVAELVQATDGNLYGTTESGGAFNDGTVFKITPGGTLTTLHSFYGADGYLPVAGLVQAADGNLYGTTSGGGTHGAGTVFRITLSGTLATLHSFNGTEGAAPSSTLVQGSDGNFYGVAENGGIHRGCTFGRCGTVFEVTPGGVLTKLYDFDSTDGDDPIGGLIQATDGNLYGTTYFGGAHDYGTIFGITPEGTLTTRYSFTGGTDGGLPSGALLQATNGNLYATARDGGANFFYGTVYGLSVGLGPFVETRPPAGKVGANVRILGNTLSGTTSVTFNGTSATFTVLSSTNIKTTVPAGATTGPVQVTTPAGTLTSNVPFQVLP